MKECDITHLFLLFTALMLHGNKACNTKLNTLCIISYFNSYHPQAGRVEGNWGK